jgi:hypothetical protein
MERLKKIDIHTVGGITPSHLDFLYTSQRTEDTGNFPDDEQLVGAIQHCRPEQ